MYSNNRNDYRQAFFVAWQKHQKNLPLEPVESELIAVILKHPEYQSLLDNFNQTEQEFILEENPFLHMSLHLAIQDQIKTNRPKGITKIYNSLLLKFVDSHDVDHLMMQCLAELLWQSQQSGKLISDDEYLAFLSSICSLDGGEDAGRAG